MRIFILGGIDDNAGPTNVNKQLMRCWDKQDEIRTNSGKGIKRLLGGIEGALWADCVIHSGGGISSSIPVFILRGIRRPYITIAHGFLPYENEINGFGYPQWKISLFLANLRGSHIIVNVSDRQREFIAARVPEVKDKLRVIYNGIERKDLPPDDANTREHIIAASGGTRPIKNNAVVLKAVEKLNQDGFPCFMKLYGHITAEGGADLLDNAGHSPYAEVMNQIDNEEFLRGLGQARVFVQNSIHEPFGLSAIDAIQQGCSLLVSKNCGVNGILELEPDDIIEDISDIDEIAQKIRLLMDHPNARRLADSIDYDRYSWKAGAEQLRKFCLETVALRRRGKR